MAIVVLDATALTPSLYLLAQVAETGVPLVVALTMVDLAAAARDSTAALIRASWRRTPGGHGGTATLAFMVFVLTYTPCVAALAEQRRLFGWRPTASALVAQLVVAWALAVLVFQVGPRL